MTPDDPSLDDLEQAATFAQMTAKWVPNMQALVASRLHDLVRLVEGEIEAPAYQNRACANLMQIREWIWELVSTINELIATQQGLLAAVRTLMQQRDEAIDARSDIYDDIVRRIMASQGCTEEQAYNLLVVLLNPDEDVMEADLCDLSSLLTLRDGLQALLEQFGYSQEESEE